MIKQLFNSGKRFLLWLLLPITSLFMVSCSSDKDEQEPTPGNGSLQMKIKTNSPQMPCELLVTSQEGSEVNTQFTSLWKSNFTIDVWAKQSGKLVYLGEQDFIVESSDKKSGTVEFDATGKLDASKPYEVYGLGCSWKRDGEDLYYRTNLHRGGSFGIYFKVAGRQNYTETNDIIAGTSEILFIINKSGSPIKFRHKGFDAEKKWYYTHAEVSIESGKMVNTEQKDEAVSDVVDIAAFTGKNAYRIYSYYVPNGNKIQDAQLIAEIDGKEVRSENRISSDITLQTNHVYGIFAIWDGEKLTLGDENGEPVVIDMTNSEESGVTIASVEKDGTMTIEATEAKAPKVGDYLCSGPTELAPYGYMLRVTEVTKLAESRSTRSLDDIKKWIWTIKTTAAAVNEVFKNLNIDVPINLSEVSIDEVTDNEGNTITMNEEQKKNWKIPIPSLKAEFLTLTPEISISPKKLTLHLHLKDWEIEKFGVDFDAEMETKVQLDATLKRKEPFEKSFDLYHVFLKPIVIPETPIVITPLFQIYLTFSGDGKAVFSFTPIHEIYNVSIGAQYNGKTGKIEPSSGNDFAYFTEKYADEDRGIANMGASFTLDGMAMVSLGASLSFGLYGCNYLDRVSFFNGAFDMFDDLLSADFWIDLNRKATAKIGISFDDIDSYWDKSDFHFTDECSWKNYVQIHAQFYARIFNPFTRKFVGVQPEIKTKEAELWSEKLFPSLFVSDFKDFQLAPNNDYVKLSADKYKPFFGYFMLNEVGLGFRYALCESNGRITGEWQDIDVTSSYSAGYSDLFKFKMEAYVPMNTFEKGKYYYVCPFVRVKVATNSLFPSDMDFYYIHRKGRVIKLTDNGTITENELPDIPGFDLN